MKLVATLLLACAASAAMAQEDDTVDSMSIIVAEAATTETRALIAQRKASPVGMSIDLRIEFEFDSSQLTEEASGQLDQLLAALENPMLSNYDFSIIGHTDGEGDEDYNQSLSERRAQAVIEYLADGGVEKSRLLAEGKGESELLFPHKPLDARNRRVEIINQGDTE